MFDRNCLIVMDDLWSIEAWEEIGRFLTNIGSGSKIVITTRLTCLASNLPYSNSLEMSLIDDVDSWDLLSELCLGFLVELKEIGKKIGKSCKRLPLSIAVIGEFQNR